MFKTHKRNLLALTALAVASALSAPAQAQCPLPDNLDGGQCCETTQLQLPKFPSFTQSSLDICWLDCGLDAFTDVTVRWGVPKSNDLGTCGPRISKVRIFDAAGGLAWRGRMNMNYSRTWFETGNNNETYQVWRFLVNGDMRPIDVLGSPPCTIPSCSQAFNRVRFTGYVDWALECNSGKWSNAWMLTHACDRVDHAPNFPRQGMFHPGRSYTFVGPAAGFSLTLPVPGEDGSSANEAVRRIRTSSINGSIGVPVCEFEEQAQHGLTPVAEYCLCGQGNSPQWQEADLTIGGACGTMITGADAASGAYFPAFLSMAIGVWTDANVYPGVEGLRFNLGDYNDMDGCTGITEHEFAFGVTTIGGYSANQISVNGVGGALEPIFIDQVNSLGRNGAAILNVPFRSSRVINLNH